MTVATVSVVAGEGGTDVLERVVETVTGSPFAEGSPEASVRAHGSRSSKVRSLSVSPLRTWLDQRASCAAFISGVGSRWGFTGCSAGSEAGESGGDGVGADPETLDMASDAVEGGEEVAPALPQVPGFGLVGRDHECRSDGDDAVLAFGSVERAEQIFGWIPAGVEGDARSAVAHVAGASEKGFDLASVAERVRGQLVDRDLALS